MFTNKEKFKRLIITIVSISSLWLLLWIVIDSYIAFINSTLSAQERTVVKTIVGFALSLVMFAIIWLPVLMERFKRSSR